jgi:hypothetical protein
VCVSCKCATVPGTAARRRHPRCHACWSGFGGSGLLPGQTSTASLLYGYCLMSSPAPDRPVSPGHAAHTCLWTARARDRPDAGARTGPSLHRSTGREDAGDLWAEEPAGPDRPPAAGSHCLNGLPVHRSVFVAARRGEGGRQGAGGKRAVRLGNAPEWLAFMLASGSRRRGRHLTPSVVIMNGHTGTLAAKAGYCLDVATPACRSRSASSFQAGAASSSMPLSGLADAASADASPVSSPALP